MKDNPLTKSNPLLDQFPIGFHSYIVDIVDVNVDYHCGYRIGLIHPPPPHGVGFLQLHVKHVLHLHEHVFFF